MSDDRPKLRKVVLHRALHRPNLLMGGERELVLASLVIAGGLIISSLNLPSVLIGIAIWTVAVVLLRQMAKADPYLSTVYRRSLRYATYYPAHSTPFRQE